MSASATPLVDGFGRTHRSLRISVTDRCNLRCRYCMPHEEMEWLPRADLLSDDEIVRLVQRFAAMGIDRLRMTGGEPLVRRGLPGLIERLAAVPGIQEISLTTNGVLLGPLVPELVAAGLARVNVSVDSLDPERFSAITRRHDLGRVLDGIDAALAEPRLRPLKVNAVIMRGLNEEDVLPLAAFAREHDVVVRFIEVMPLDSARSWTPVDVMSGAQVRAMIARRWPLEPMGRGQAADTGVRFRFADRPERMIETVSSVTESFCATCDRLRLTADGHLKTCLFAEDETDLRGPLRDGADDARLDRIVRGAVLGKGPGHGMSDPSWSYTGRPMNRIGG
jgi:cyclic pyranopterin phosphate synthase